MSDLLPQFRQGEQSRFIVLPIPYEKTTSYKKGTAKGPRAIINALNQVEFYDEELMCETHRAGIHTIPIRTVKSVLPFNQSPAIFGKKLSQYVKPFVTRRQMLIALGGEHSITYGLVAPFVQQYPDLSVLHLDAHSDLRNQYEGSCYGHATVIKRVSELCPVTQVGIRSLGEDDYKIINQGNIHTFLAHRMYQSSLRQIVPQIMKTLTKNIYLTIDLDVFDPSCLPGVGTPEPGGLSWYEVLEVLRPVFQQHHIVGMDIVELCPLTDNNISEFIAAKLLYRLIGYGYRYNRSIGQRNDKFTKNSC